MPMFDTVMTLPPGNKLHLYYTVVIADGAWDRQRILGELDPAFT